MKTRYHIKVCFKCIIISRFCYYNPFYIEAGSEKTILKTIARLCGIPLITARNDGEKGCAELMHYKQADIALSYDSDMFLFDIPYFILNYDALTCTCTVVDKKKILSTLGITPSQLIDIGLMSGTDYSKGIRMVGCNKAYKKIKNNNLPEWDGFDKFRPIFQLEEKQEFELSKKRPDFTAIKTMTKQYGFYSFQFVKRQIKTNWLSPTYTANVCEQNDPTSMSVDQEGS